MNVVLQHVGQTFEFCPILLTGLQFKLTAQIWRFSLLVALAPYTQMHHHHRYRMLDAGADPGFPVGGSANRPGVPTYDFVKFFKKMHEIETILGRSQVNQGPGLYSN